MYFLYLLRCEGGVIYTGVAADFEKRLAEHLGKSGKGAKFTRARKPLAVGAVFDVKTRRIALKLEYRVKRLTHADKEKILADPALLKKEYFPQEAFSAVPLQVTAWNEKFFPD